MKKSKHFKKHKSATSKDSDGIDGAVVEHFKSSETYLRFKLSKNLV